MLPEGFDQGASNPFVRFDDRGTAYITFMAVKYLGDIPALANPNFFNPERNASDREFGFKANNGNFLAHSDDGGTTWQAPTAIISHLYMGQEVFFEINPDLGVDTHRLLPSGQPNPNYGNMYAVWSRLYPVDQFPGHPEIFGGIDIMIAVSRNRGRTWETQTQELNGVQATVIQDPENTVGLLGLGIVDQPHMTIGPEGNLYVSHGG